MREIKFRDMMNGRLRHRQLAMLKNNTYRNKVRGRSEYQVVLEYLAILEFNEFIGRYRSHTQN